MNFVADGDENKWLSGIGAGPIEGYTKRQEVMNTSGAIYLTMDMCSNTLDRIHSWNMIR